MTARTRIPALLAVFALSTSGCGAAPPAVPGAPAPAPSAAPAPADERVLPHDTFTLMSRGLGELRRIHVYLPPGYAAAPAVRYPVLYMPDGGLEEDFPHVSRTVDESIRAGAMRPVIVVGIENTERRRDMTGPTQVEEDRRIAPRVGGSAAFRAFLRDELMPVVQARVRGDGETGIIGESLAGLFIFETFLLEPALFDHYIALSPSLWWNHQALLRGAAERLKALPARPTTLYVTTAGDDDLDSAGATLVTALRAASAPALSWLYEPMPNERHATIYRAAAPIALAKTFPATAPGRAAVPQAPR